MEIPDFIRNVFYRQARLNAYIPEPKMIIGHNQVFDIGAISRHTGEGCDEKLYGALSLGLCNCRSAEEIAKAGNEPPKFEACGYHPNLKIKKLGPGKHVIECGARFDGFDARGNRKYAGSCLEFLDTRQLAGALLGPCDRSLQSLCLMLKTTTQKQEPKQGHGQEINDEYLDYARNDVQCTWELYVKLRDLYRLYGITRRITKIYSEASLGKGLCKDFGIQSFFGYNPKTKRNTRNMDFDPKILGIAMEGLFGGRSEARIRHQIWECMLPDFRSQYPSVNALMKMQDLLLCENLGVERGADTKAKNFLETVELADFQDPATWSRLRGFAKCRPHDKDTLPFRCEYETTSGAKQTNVGVNHIQSATDGWWTFADICKSKILTGRCPEILETIEFIPIGRQTTKIINLFGDPRFKIDLTKDDLFTKVIELRTTVQGERAAAAKKYGKASPEYNHLDAIQLALKLLANATSYGITIEVVVDERAAQVPCMIYHGGDQTRRVAKKKQITRDGDLEEGFKVERPGGYFAPYGPLIPAGGRLFLGLAERLFRDRGIYAHLICDTDAMCPAKPPSMNRVDFQKAVLEVAGPNGWFQRLSPYSDGKQFFAMEDANFKLVDESSGNVTGELEPLYGFAISAKRYALFNIGPPTRKYPKGETIIRKISGHGLGHLRRMPDYDPNAHPLTKPEHVAAPSNKKTGSRAYDSLVYGSTPRLLCDIWRIAINCFREFPDDPNRALDRIDNIVAKLPQLQTPQYTHMSLSSNHLLKLYPNLPNRRGFQFFTTFPKPRCSLASRDLVSVPLDEHKALCETSLYASVPKEGVDTTLIEEWKNTKTGIFRRDNNEFPHGLFNPEWRLRLETVAEALRGYFRHEEPKSIGNVGVLERRTIVSLDKHFIGKETNPLDDDNEDAQDEDPITTSNDLVLRGATRNLQPLVKAGIEFRQGKRLTNAELKTVKSRAILQDDGSLKPRGAIEDGDVHGYISRPVWAARLKTWGELNRFGNFEKVAKVSGLPAIEIEQAARYGNHDDKCAEINWGKTQAAIDELTGRTARRARLTTTKERQRPRDAKRDATRRNEQKLKVALAELQSADGVVFPSDIVNEECALCFDELDARFIRREVRKLFAKYSTCPELRRRNGDVDAAEIVKLADDVTGDMTSPVIEYWGDEARKQSWLRLSERLPRFDKWSACQG